MATRLIEHSPFAGALPPRFSCNYLRAVELPLAAPGPMSAYPFAWVVAEQPWHNNRTVYFVDLLGLMPDGVWWPRARQPYRQARIVDAYTLAAPSKVRRRSLTLEQKASFRHWRRFYRTEWRDKLAGDSPAVERWRTRLETFLDRFVSPLPSKAAILRTEDEIVRFDEFGQPTVKPKRFHPLPISYLRETWFTSPDGPNRITPRSLGEGKEIIAFARIQTLALADAGWRSFPQRAWFVDHNTGDKRHCDGIDPVQNWRGCVPFNVVVGMPSPAFDPRELQTELDPNSVAAWRTRKQDWTTRNNPETHNEQG